MKRNNLLLFAGMGIAVFFIARSKNASAATYDGIDLNRLADYGNDDVHRLSILADELESRGLSDLQIKMLLSQALQETGIFTDNSANYNAVDNLHNYAGISYNGQLAHYNNVSAFVDDWLRVLQKGSNPPLYANNITDFNNRLKANGYYTDSQSTYGKNLTYYYNLLN